MKTLTAIPIVTMLIGCAGQESGVTELDKALAAAQEDQAKAESFYNLFLNSDVFIPTHDAAPRESGFHRTQAGESFSPFVVESDNVPCLPIFDTLERLQAWARGREITYVQMPAHTFIRSSFDPRLHIGLNVGTPHFKEFVPDELSWLRQAVEAQEVSDFAVPAGTKVRVGVPANIPDGLEEALRSCMSRNREVKAAFLSQIHFDLPGEEPQLFLIPKLDDVGKDCLQTINEDIGVATRGLLGNQESLTIQVYNENGISSEVVTRIEPFYTRP